MKNLILASLIFLSLNNYCFGHKDTVLSLEDNGAIIGLPDQYLPATLKIKFASNTDTIPIESIQISVAKNEVTLPQCIVKLIKTSSASDISLSASWYHKSSSLPHYMNINLYDPGYTPEKWANPKYSLLVNLVSARVIDMTYTEFAPNGNSSRLLPVKFSSLCQEKEIDGFLDGKPAL
ncbi:MULTISPECIES: hypothetical protein [unclassified Pseudomonas]|uniref:hypothetical protein n=1 Tax=unclassified Pseudomonas TaxID=196821 RepID=UPI0024468D02|nr:MULTISPECIES: hypothetical protein [unclassified Pseudomonas]MDG9926338.1 hypothetical protein [Pseudomonas sp. GD04045]MDH0037587.1 hypothetical protein [Pseudomonas sp. GD04019]